MKNFFQRFSSFRLTTLRSRLIAVFLLATLVPALIIESATAYNAFNDSRQHTNDQFTSVISLKETQINNWLDVLQTELNAEIAVDETRAIPRIATTPGADAAFTILYANELQRLQQTIALRATFEELFILNSQGEVILSTIKSQEGKVLSNEIFFTDGQKSPTIEPPTFSSSLNKYSIIAARPIIDQNGKAVGVLAGRANFKILDQIMLERSGLGETGETYLVGTNFALLTGSRFFDAARGTFYVRTTGSTNAINLKVSGNADYPDYRNIPVIGSYKWMPRLQVAIIAEQDQSEAYQSIITSILISLVITLIAITITISFSFVIARNITTPIEKLAALALKVEQGILTETVVVQSKDEIGILATGFNNMLARVRDFIGSLEQRVNERTQELTQAQEHTRGLLNELDEATRIAQLANYELEVSTQTLVLSDRFYELLGTTVSTEGGYRQPLPHVVQKFVHPDDAARLIEEIKSIGTGANPESGEFAYRFRHANGETHYFALRYSVERDVENNIVRLKGAAQDVTERQKAQEAQQRYTTELANWQNAVGEAAIVAITDVQGKIEYANENFSRISKYPVQELLGRDHRIINSGYHSKEYIRDMWTTIANGKTWRGEFRNKSKDGTYYWVDTVIAPILNQNGKPEKYLAIRFDITQRKSADEAIAKRAVELETVTNLSTSIANITDQQEMLQTVVDQVKERFHFYHAHIYLFNDANNALVLTAGAGAAGRQMVTEKRTIPLNREHSLVARAARTKIGVMVNDVAQEPDFLPNPLLPNTKAELATPLLIGDTVLGVLDVQADEIEYFSNEDLRIQTILAAQIATALQNARSFAQSEKARQELDNLTRRLTREGWQTLLDQSNTKRLGFLYNEQKVQQLTETTPELPPANGHTILQPITVRGETFGQLVTTESEKEDSEVAAVLEAVSQVLGTHLDNLRLGEQTQDALSEAQQRTQDLGVLNEMGRALTNLRNEDEIYRTIHEFASRLMNTATFFIATYNSQTQTVSFPISYNNNQPNSIAPRTLGNGLTDYIIRARQPLLFKHSVIEEVEKLGVDMVFFGGKNIPLSWVGVPIVFGNETIGVISAQSTTLPDVYTEIELNLLTTIASQAAISIENVRSFQATQRRAEREATINAISQKIQSATSVDGAIQTAIEELGRTLKAKRTTVTMTPPTTDYGK